MSVVLYGAAIYNIIKSQLHPVVRFIVLFTDVFVMFKVILHDLGTESEHHGGYNLAIFVAISTIAAIAIPSWYLIRKYKIGKQVAIGSFILWLYIIFLHAMSERGLENGLLGQSMKFLGSCRDTCCIEMYTPWFDFNLKEFLNYHGDPKNCDHVTRSISTLNKDGTLMMYCPKDQPYYIVNPELGIRDLNYDFVENERMDVVNIDRLWAKIEHKNLRKNYTEPVKITEGEYIQTFCGEVSNFHVQNIFSEKILKNSIFEREKFTRNFTDQFGKEDPNVIVFMLNSLSRPKFLRKLHRVTSLMKDLEESKKFKILEFFRFHSVSHGNPGNRRPLLAGISSAEFRRGNISEQEIEISLFWQRYKEHGYVTAWINDICQDVFNLNFQLENPGLDYESVLPYCNHDPKEIDDRCLGGRHKHEYVLDYAKQFFQNFPTVPKLLTASISDFHEISTTDALDKSLSEFLTDILKDHPNTIVVMVADRGLPGRQARFESGSVENALPALFQIWPTAILRGHSDFEKNILGNRQKLISHWDLHKTLLHVLDRNLPAGSRHPYVDQKDIMWTSSGHQPMTYVSASRSLFSEIEPTRSCSDAGIPAEHCQCSNQ
eukprot:TRINITY_DN1969_c0_g3_i1.p1 TRINITY_DN1969_c0_g3~~TRINITY_DN1969_c0_g3_i1.p1  ORF type:complete len:706 (-),score=191.77 TRINITY_DN1969_c0_g3_i1:29-1837(-)